MPVINELTKVIALATSTITPNGVDDDDILARYIESRGHEYRIVVWNDPSVDWHIFDMVVIRSTWDYHHSIEEFFLWIERVSRQTTIVNCPQTIKFLVDKRYLLHFLSLGVPVVPTSIGAAGEILDFGRVCNERGWSDVIVKPAVSLGSFKVRRFAYPADRNAGQAHIDALDAYGGAVIQPFVEDLVTKGERSLIYIEGRYSHAVLRGPMTPGSETPLAQLHEASETEKSVAGQVLGALPAATIFARVDLAATPQGPLLTECEAVEPRLFFGLRPKCAEHLTDALFRRLSNVKAKINQDCRAALTSHTPSNRPAREHLKYFPQNGGYPSRPPSRTPDTLYAASGLVDDELEVN
ncbi:hypothetical protein JQ600_09310 [Bradyrhizobium sp. AUGA SZCCT0176]|uniref:ATP-grasp domain-containing protein n=1 Tax=Bradyrhizobium sp. AUGA SZCCT0176 TaxID=2807664 RepID=UPI001BAA8467|nr:hypothetical protein [Bradyrhizobium sp. AUGA SZCCT0176]MBR1225113.1 hypothetical protein [Bradyrhizobium sp. AUGA SZCCT0176]